MIFGSGDRVLWQGFSCPASWRLQRPGKHGWAIEYCQLDGD